MREIQKENINVNSLLKGQVMREKLGIDYGKRNLKQNSNLQSIFYDPFLVNVNMRGKEYTISPYYQSISYKILRRISEKAWILNLCISNIIKKVRPFLKPLTEGNTRGFTIKKRYGKDGNKKHKMNLKEKEEARKLELFFMNTGDVEDSNRVDDLDKYVSKILRDLCQLDQIACEIQRTKAGDVCAFWAIDPGTIEITLPYSAEDTGIKYVQVINYIPYAYYKNEDLIFDCMNPRTDIERSGYGYSIVEQAIDLVTSAINTFVYNAGFFTENKIPRGFLLLNGDAEQEDVESMEEYIINIMSGSPSSLWKVPIIPSGENKNGEGNRTLEWVKLQETNKEMEYQSWMDFQLSGIVGLFGLSMEDLGLHSQKSAPLIGNNTSPKIESSKSLVLGDMLSFLQKHFNKILKYKNPEYEFDFVGYERDDPKTIIDIDKEEMTSFKSLNEKREEKGYRSLDFSKIKNPADLPMNPHVIQAWQGMQQEEQSEQNDGYGMEEMENIEGLEGADYMEGIEDENKTESELNIGQTNNNTKESSLKTISKSIKIIV